MYRVALVAALAVSLGACSLNTGAITSGFANSSSSSAPITGSIEPLGGTRSGLSNSELRLVDGIAPQEQRAARGPHSR